MENRSHALIAGSFVLLVTAMLVALALWLTRDTEKQFTYQITTREAVSGLQPQAAVRFRGVPVGKVTAIGFDPQVRGQVLITISTNEGAPITTSTYAMLGFQGVTGLAYVQLEDAGESSVLLATNDKNPARIPLRAGFLSRLIDQASGILLQVEESSRSLNLLLAPDNQKILFGAVQDIGQSAKSFNTAATTFQQFSSNANRILDAQFGPERMNLPKLVDELNTSLKTLQATSQTVGATAEEFKKASQSLSTAITQTAGQTGATLEKIGQSADALTSATQNLTTSALPRLNRATDEASRAAKAVGRLSATLNETPQALIFGTPAAPGPGEPGFMVPAK